MVPFFSAIVLPPSLNEPYSLKSFCLISVERVSFAKCIKSHLPAKKFKTSFWKPAFSSNTNLAYQGPKGNYIVRVVRILENNCQVFFATLIRKGDPAEIRKGDPADSKG
jgi:hypothetical protein